MSKKTYTIIEACQFVQMTEEDLLDFIAKEWLQPLSHEPFELDEEDVARSLLIRELREDFGVNDEGIPLILHLLDQIHFLHSEVRRRL